MKKVWEKPEVSDLKVEDTQYGYAPNQNHDATTYDSEGNWWAAGAKES